MQVKPRIPILSILAATACLALDVDRAAAEWVIHMGGTVVLTGSPAHISDIDGLPASGFEIRSINLTQGIVGPLELHRIGSLPGLKELYLSGRT